MAGAASVDGESDGVAGTAVASAAGETMTFASEQPLTFDEIEIEAVGQPGGGAIDIKLDGSVAAHYDLAASRMKQVLAVAGVS